MPLFFVQIAATYRWHGEPEAVRDTQVSGHALLPPLVAGPLRLPVPREALSLRKFDEQTLLTDYHSMSDQAADQMLNDTCIVLSRRKCPS